MDIDLNYIGGPDKKLMEKERPDLEKAIQDVCSRANLIVRRAPTEHAGGKWLLKSPSAPSESSNKDTPR